MSKLFSIEGVDVIYVDSADLLHICAEALAKAKVVAVDTEFIRVSTFFPKLALLQVYDGQSIYLIDAPAITGKLEIASEDFNRLWSGIIEFFNSDSIVKVFHACEEDLELLHYYYGVLPQSLFDTQLVCGFVGLDYPMGYQKLVAEMCDEHVEKGDSRSNWLQRPLTQSQLSYAAYDVVFLIDIYRTLLARLEKTALQLYFEQDCRSMVSSLTVNDFSGAYLKIKSHVKLSALPLWRLQQLAVWRESSMRRSDIPRNKVATNEALMILAKKGESANTWLYKVEGLPGATVKRYEKELKDILSAKPADDVFALFKRRAALDAKYMSQQQKKFKLSLQEQAQLIGLFGQLMVKKPWLEATVLQFELEGDVSVGAMGKILGDDWRSQFYLSSLKVLKSLS